MSIIKKYFFTPFLYLVYLLFLLEVFLRLGGVLQPLYTKYVLAPQKTPLSGSVNILCIGDSLTNGVGAPFRESYPAQLERLLNTHSTEKTYTVINRGVPGLNSSQCLELAKYFIPLYRPEVVIVLCGNNDYWNWENVLLQKYPDVLTPYEYVLTRLKIFASNLRIYKLYYTFFLRSFVMGRNAHEQIHNTNYSFWDEKTYVSINEHINKNYFCEKNSHKFGERKKALLSLVLKNNVEEMCSVVHLHDSVILLLSYPLNKPKNRISIIETVAKKQDVLYIDIEKAIREKNSEGREFLSEDNFHPNAYGYSLMVDTIYNTLIDLGIIAGEKTNALS